MLERLARAPARARPGPFQSRAYVDTGPIVERAYAAAAGLGRLGQEHLPAPPRARLLVLPGRGRDRPRAARPTRRAPTCAGAARPASTPAPPARCAAPYVLDATRCISYLTIELKGAIPEEQRAGVGRHVFGCDICQDVCPWNRKRRRQRRPRRSRRAPGLHGARPRRAGRARRGRLPRSASAAARSSAPSGAACCATWRSRSATPATPPRRPVLERLAADEDPLVREHARWALARLRRQRRSRRP